MTITQQELNLDDSINLLIENRLMRVNSCMPAFIKSYDANTKLCEVQPIFKMSGLDYDEKEIIQDLPIIVNVPIMFPRMGGFYIKFPVKTNDRVLLLFSQRSIDNYLETDGKTTLDPEINDIHDISDAIAAIGLSTNKDKIPTNDNTDFMIASENGNFELHFTPSGDMKIKGDKFYFGDLTANKALALAQQVDARLGALESFQNSHIHIDPISGVTGVASVPFVAGGTPPGGTTASMKGFIDG